MVVEQINGNKTLIEVGNFKPQNEKVKNILQ